MDDYSKIIRKYSNVNVHEDSQSESELNNLVYEFCDDLVSIADILSRLINRESNPNYYDLNESTVVGLITRMIKLYIEYVDNFKANKLEILSLFARPLYESFITSKYLIKNGKSSQVNFRLISYQARYQNFNKLIKLSDQHPLIKRQLLKLEGKLEVDNFTIDDLSLEDKKPFNKRWKLDGKSFWKIHAEVDNADVYSFIYGVGSDAVHGNWQEIFDFHLTRKGIGYTGFLNYEKCDCRVIVPVNSIVIEIMLHFLNWNNCLTNEIKSGLVQMKSINDSLYTRWEEKFGETIIK